MLTVLRTRGLDLLTAVFAVVAVYLLMQPTSQLRMAWAERSESRESARIVERKWADLGEAASPLYRGTAPIEIVEVSDYECPFCRANSAGVDSAVAAGARIAYLHLPMARHPRAEGAALAALCAEESDRFPEMHARLMTFRMADRF